MPGRKVVLATNQFYHVLNRGIALLPIFNDKHDYRRALETALFYRTNTPPFRYSFLDRLSKDGKEQIKKNVRENQKDFLIEIVAYCFMPNHFHFLLRQTKDDGISKFMSNFSNSYTRYFNARHQREGSLFQGKFKAIRIESEEQLIHLSRYIHLNPYSGFIIKKIEEIEDYPHSSLREYLGLARIDVCQKDPVFAYFKNRSKYKKFVLDRADYQRELEKIKHLALEN